MLGTQLGQMMCAQGYKSAAAGLASGLLILTGLVGSFIIGPIARRLGRQVEAAKLSFALSSIGLLMLSLALRHPDALPAIFASLTLFGFFGLGAFPLTLELAVEESYPADPVYSEAFIHISGQGQAIAFILLGNVMHWQPTLRILEHQVCLVEGEGAVKPWDYTPYLYLVMMEAFFGALAYIFFINPQLRRAKLDAVNLENETPRTVKHT